MTRLHARASASALLAGILAATIGCASSGATRSGAPSRQADQETTSAAAGAAQALTPQPPTQDYLVFVASEATDEISLVRFGPGGAKVERRTSVGIMLTDPDGPHGLGVAPDGKHYYVSTAHGTPFGRLWKISTLNDEPVGQTTLGNFPASLQVSPDGLFAYVVNFNLHGEMVPSSVSVVSTNEMVEIARIPTCTMPHGSRLTADGSRHYSTCMMDEMLIEIDTRTLGVSRHFMLGKGGEHGMAGAPKAHGGMMHGPPPAAAGAASAGNPAPTGGHGMDAPPAGNTVCSPTWAAPSPDGSRVYVACNKSSDVVEVDATTWKLVRRMPAGEGAYNLAVQHDGTRLLVTNKRGQSVSVLDLRSGREIARIPTTRPVVHGVTISPDDRYAFISIEGVGSAPGTVDIIDLAMLKKVASVEVGQMAGGIDFWKTEPVAARRD